MPLAQKDLIRFLMATAIIFGAYNLTVALAHLNISLVPLNTGTRNTIIAERYFYRGHTPSAVIVGSSMSRRLGYGNDSRLADDFYNLALDGGEASTGLSLVLAKASKPKIVVVEMNWLQRAPNAELIDYITRAPTDYFRSSLPGMRLEFTPQTLISVVAADRPLRELPYPGYPKFDPTADHEDPAIERSLSYTTLKWGRETDESVKQITRNAADILEQVEALKAAGVRVVLMWLPIHPRLEATPLFTEARRICRAVFPPDKFEWFDVPNPSSYHTSDSIHLTPISGIIVSKHLLAFLAKDHVGPVLGDHSGGYE